MKVLPLSLLAVSLLIAAHSAAFGQQDTSQAKRVEIPPLVIGNEVYIPQDKLALGPVRVHPFLHECFGHDSNIYLDAKEYEVSDSMLITEAGARFDFTYSRQLVLAGYRIRLNNYDKYDRSNNTEHEAELLGNFHLDSFFIKLKDSYAHLVEPTPVNYKTKARREENRGRIGFGIELEKLYAELAYGNRRYHFEGKDYDAVSNKQSIVSGEVGLAVAPKTRVSVKFDWGSVNYDYNIQNNYTYTSFYLGGNYKVAGKLLSNLYLGWTSQSVDTKNDPLQTKEFSGFTATGGLAYELSKKTTLNATLLRELQYSTWTVNYLVVTKIQTVARYRWTPKIMVSARVTYEQSDLQNPAPTLTKWIVGLSGRYDFNHWITAGLDLEFSTRSASPENKVWPLNYSRNAIFGFVTMHF